VPLARDPAVPSEPPEVAAIVGDHVLDSVFCVSRSDCWAVGSAELNDATRNQALHFNGRRWVRVPTPSPGGTAAGDDSELDGVWCTSGSNCWATGSFETAPGTLTQALRWNGRTWARVRTPNPHSEPKGFNDLLAVTCTSAANCWAAGDDGFGLNDVNVNLIEHWNGHRWSLARVPQPGGTATGDLDEVLAVPCTSARNCWGVGTDGQITAGGNAFDNEVLHWTGGKWRKVGVPSPGTSDAGIVESALNAAFCTSARNCWAVGIATDAHGARNQALRMTRGRWRVVATPNPSTENLSQLSGMSCTTGTNCWAVGEYDAAASLNQVLHWTGRSWHLETVPQPGGIAGDDANALAADFCISPKDCWAVGDIQPIAEPEKDEFLHFTGRKWADAGT
jgi:hypothetical protein